MKLADIQARVDAIRRVSRDSEQAHIDEDELRADVLMAIAGGLCDDPAEAARLALTTSGIDFCRWYA